LDFYCSSHELGNDATIQFLSELFFALSPKQASNTPVIMQIPYSIVVEDCRASRSDTDMMSDDVLFYFRRRTSVFLLVDGCHNYRTIFRDKLCG